MKTSWGSGNNFVGRLDNSGACRGGSPLSGPAPCSWTSATTSRASPLLIISYEDILVRLFHRPWPGWSDPSQ